jgi:hypothetical protein
MYVKALTGEPFSRFLTLDPATAKKEAPENH